MILSFKHLTEKNLLHSTCLTYVWFLSSVCTGMHIEGINLGKALATAWESAVMGLLPSVGQGVVAKVGGGTETLITVLALMLFWLKHVKRNCKEIWYWYFTNEFLMRAHHMHELAIVMGRPPLCWLGLVRVWVC